MEDVSNVSSEEELLQLRNEGKISQDEYQQLRNAMRESAKLDVETPAAGVEQAKSKRKLGKIAFYLMLAGIVFPAVWFVFSLVLLERRATPLRMPVVPNGEDFALTAVGEHRTGMGLKLCLFAPFTLIFEIAAFVMGVIAWPDVFAKVTVVTISFIVVLALLFGLLTVA